MMLIPFVVEVHPESRPDPPRQQQHSTQPRGSLAQSHVLIRHTHLFAGRLTLCTWQTMAAIVGDSMKRC